jgi:hypothetical protein
VQPDGTFDLAQLPLGTHTVVLHRTSYNRLCDVPGSARTVIVGAGEPAHVAFDLADFPLASVAGRFVADGPLPDGLVVDLVRPGANGRPEVFGGAVVGADGKFAFADLLPGTYRFAYRTQPEGAAWLPGLQPETVVVSSGDRLAHTARYTRRRLVVHFRGADGREVNGDKIRARCDGMNWPAILFFSPTVNGPLVLDPAPMLPIEFAGFADNRPWSAPVVMPPDRREAEVTVVLQDAVR